MKTLIENQFGHGAIKLNIVHRKVSKLFRNKLGRGLPFDWNKGYDVRDIIGPIIIKNQGTNDSCSGQAGSYFLEIQRRLQQIKEGALSAKSFYSRIAYPGGGAPISALMTQLGAHGANLETIVSSYDISGNPLVESYMINKTWETPALLQEAETRAGYTPYDIGESIEDVASAIQSYGAVIWEIRGKNNGTWLSSYPQPPVKGNLNPYFYHYMCATGAKIINGKKYIIALQSMGPQVGEGGIQYFGEDYFNSGHIIDCFTFVYDTQLIPDSNNHSIWAEVTRWFRIQWKLANSLT